jgi:hypothetical protein
MAVAWAASTPPFSSLALGRMRGRGGGGSRRHRHSEKQQSARQLQPGEQQALTAASACSGLFCSLAGDSQHRASPVRAQQAVQLQQLMRWAPTYERHATTLGRLRPALTSTAPAGQFSPPPPTRAARPALQRTHTRKKPLLVEWQEAGSERTCCRPYVVQRCLMPAPAPPQTPQNTLAPPPDTPAPPPRRRPRLCRCRPRLRRLHPPRGCLRLGRRRWDCRSR